MSCNHAVEPVEVFGKEECIECVLLKLTMPLRSLSDHKKWGMGLETSLNIVKQSWNLSHRDILLMGWAWNSWKERS